jgi:prefoldin subunit 5
MVFEEELSIPAEVEADEPEMEVPRDLSQPSAPKADAGQATFSRNAIIWLIFGTMLVSVSLAVLLNLAILDGINNTLNIGKHSSVRQVANDMAALQVEVDELASLMTSIDRRMEAVEGLGGRVVSVEKEFSVLHEKVTQSIERMDSVHDQIDELTQQMDLLSESVSSFDTFLNGLRQLLMGSSSSIEPESTPQP